MSTELAVSLCSIAGFIISTVTMLIRVAIVAAEMRAQIAVLKDAYSRIEQRSDKFSAYPARLSVLESQVGSIREMRAIRPPSQSRPRFDDEDDK